MTEIRPTTDEVLLAYIDRADFLAQVKGCERKTDDELSAEFRSWLAEVKRPAEEFARDLEDQIAAYDQTVRELRARLAEVEA